MRARIIVNNLRQHYIHTITLDGIRDKENAFSLVHPTVYYTLNNIPEGQKLSLSEVSTKNTSGATAKKTAAAKTAGKSTAGSSAKSLTYAQVKPLLTKYTCISCHNPAKKQIGPAFSDIAQRKYSADKMMQLIYNPNPKNWPGYAVAMPPMQQVPRSDARKIVTWIKSLEKK
jgi:cytochrome c551/c552